MYIVLPDDHPQYQTLFSALSCSCSSKQQAAAEKSDGNLGALGISANSMIFTIETRRVPTVLGVMVGVPFLHDCLEVMSHCGQCFST